MRSKRLLSILDELRSRRRPVSAEVLANALGVSVRTIYRDMQTLQTMGAPIRGESGMGYQIDGGTFLPPLHLAEDELDALLIGVRMLQSRADSELSDAAARALSKIGAALPETLDHPFQDSPLLALSAQASTSKLRAGMLSELCEVIRRKIRTHITYEDLKGRKSYRCVRPLGVTCFDSVWLFTAWCETREDFRNFRVDRVTSVERTDSQFKDRRGQSFKDYIRTL